MFEADIKNKIKTIEELLPLLGERPRDQKVIMCHGTFDIVHPGHVRHLIYAKSKADTLVVSLTSDAHIKKANFRPFVPEDLRGFNLAALEMVDYVVIDRDPTPLKNLFKIQPDYFAKGYEYVNGGADPRTQEEIDVLESYGGEFIYTPGDVVYSSSKIIEASPPNLAIEKLVSLMEAENLTFADLRHALQQIQGTKAHVIGDTIVDTHTRTTLIGGNTKTPTFSVRYESQTDYVGGAGIVAKHMQAAGADVNFTTVLGDDPLQEFVLNDLDSSGVKANAIIDETRPTTNKNVFIAGGYRLLKVDTLDNRPISKNIMKQFTDSISGLASDVVMFCDFRHGIFSQTTIPALIKSIPEGVYRVADSQVATRWGNILDFPGFNLITPNESEARFSLGDQDSVVRPLALKLYQRAACETLILKLGDRGLITYRTPPKNREDVRAFFVVDSFVDNLVDAVGSGDALLAYSTLIMRATGNEVLSSVLGSMAAAVACEFEGNLPVMPEALEAKIANAEKQANYF